MAEKIRPIIFYPILFLFILAFGTTAKNYDYDLWARLIVGKELFQTGHIFSHDFLSYIPTHPIIDHEWGSGVILYLTQKLFGISGFVLLQSILIFLTFIFIIKTIKLRGIKTTYAYNILFYYFGFMAISDILNAPVRCQLFTFLFFSIFLYLLEKTRLKDYENSKIIYSLPLMMIFWCNLHGGCVIGIGLIILYIIGEALNRKSIKKYIYALCLCFSALLINPWGWHYLPFLLNTNSDTRILIAEWGSPFSKDNIIYFEKFRLFLFTLLGAEILYAIKQIYYKNIKIDKTKVLVTAATIFAAIKYIKLIPFCIFTLSIFLYDDFYQIFNLLTFNIFNKHKNFKDILIYIIFILFAFFNIKTNGLGPYLDFKRYPVLAVEFIKTNHLKGNLFTDFSYGSYASYKLYPQNKIYMDGRYDTVYYPWAMPVLMKFLFVGKHYDKLLSTYPPDLILINNMCFKIYDKLSNEGSYVRIYNDTYFSVFSKHKTAKNYAQPSSDINYYKKTILDTDINFKGEKWQKN